MKYIAEFNVKITAPTIIYIIMFAPVAEYI